MAYLTKEETTRIRKELKDTFPQFKFSVTNHRYSCLNVAIMGGPENFCPNMGGYGTINPYYTDRYESSELEQMMVIIKKNWYDRSDIQFDYFDTAFFISLTKGKWDRPYTVTGL